MNTFEAVLVKPEAAGMNNGDKVRVTLERDTEPRTVEVPTELQAALADDPQARDAFERLSYSHRQEYAGWVAEAKKEETRARRAAKAIEMLCAGGR